MLRIKIFTGFFALMLLLGVKHNPLLENKHFRPPFAPEIKNILDQSSIPIVHYPQNLTKLNRQQFFNYAYKKQEVEINIEIPSTIEIRITGLRKCIPNMKYHVEHISFMEYVKGVLPNEWGKDWHGESLKAGAVAVKEFALYMNNTKGYVWDCNWDQVYRPSWRTAETDLAVEESWNWWVYNDGIIATYYDDWPNACQSRNQYTNCMSQWLSLNDVKNGMTFDKILEKYYSGKVIFLKTKHQPHNAKPPLP